MPKRLSILIVLMLVIHFVAAAQGESDSTKGQINPLIQYGALGIIVIAMFWYILFLHKERKAERAEYNTMIQKQFDKGNTNDEKAVEATKEFSNILAGLKTLIELDINKKIKES